MGDFSAIYERRGAAVLTFAALAVTAVAAPARAQLPQGPCDPEQILDPWQGGEVGAQSGGSQTDVGGGEIELCGRADGLGQDEDTYRYLTQQRAGDFVIEAELTDLDAGSQAGLLAVGPNRMPNGARVALVVDKSANGQTITLGSSIRHAVGASTGVAPASVEVELPLLVRLVRQAGEVRTEYEDAEGVHVHLSADVAGGTLEELVSTGPFAAAGGGGYARARFAALDYSAQNAPPEVECVESPAIVPGEPVKIRGLGLESVRGARLAGVEAEVLSASPDSLVVRAPLGSGAPFARGELVLDGPAGPRVVPGGVAFGGKPFVRGDANLDGDVDASDWQQICYQVYRKRPLECGESGDVNADGVVDQADLDHLRRFLTSADAPPPAAPFPRPGHVPGAYSCGLPPGPQLTALTDERGRGLRRAVGEGDVIVLRGAELPTGTEALAYLGNVPTRILPGSDEGELHLRIGRVPSDGVRCPVLWRTRPTGRRAAHFGQAFTVEPESGLCPELVASPGSLGLESHTDGRRVLLDIPRERLPLGERVEVDVAMHLPFVDGVSRGPRGARFSVLLPRVGRDPYANALQILADEIQKALSGDDDDECGCEVAANPYPNLQQLEIANCLEIPPPPPPPPTLPGLPTDIKKTTILVGHLGLARPQLPGVDCDEVGSYEDDPLAFSWCHLASMLLPPEEPESPFLDGYPAFEGLIPHLFAWSEDYGHPWHLVPDDKPLEQKHILVEQPIDSRSAELGYNDGCDYVMRTERCDTGFRNHWMPRFPDGSRVVKPFWVGESQLPAGYDFSGFYSWDPPPDDHSGQTVNPERQYLVGLHVAVAIDDPWGGSDAYFRWITAWAPLPLNVDGGNRYNRDCSWGTELGRPDSLNGTPFEGWLMCNPDIHGSCGNPWAPLDECTAPENRDCVGCHSKPGNTPSAVGDLRVAWLTQPQLFHWNEIVACGDAVANDPNYMPNWGGPIVENHVSPFNECASIPGDEDPLECYLAGRWCSSTP